MYLICSSMFGIFALVMIGVQAWLVERYEAYPKIIFGMITIIAIVMFIVYLYKHVTNTKSKE